MTKGPLRVISLTNQLLRYRPSLELQEQLVAERKAGAAPDTLLVVQHHPVFTVGKRGTSKDFLTDKGELAKLDFDVVTVPRGGETTYHGPGQIVAYPILNLRQLGLGARAFVEGLEDAMVQAVGCFGIQARGRVPGKTGVWVGERKIGAVGVRITHGISSHGIALNVATDLSMYKHIVPCGTPDKEVTSVMQELHMPLKQLLKAGQSDPVALQSADRTVGLMNQQAHGMHPVAEPSTLMKVAETCLISSIAQVVGLEADTSDTT